MIKESWKPPQARQVVSQRLAQLRKKLGCTYKIATLNIRTITDDKLIELCTWMKKYHVVALALQELRLPKDSLMQTPPGYIRLFGPTGEKGERGCGWILHEGWAERNAQLEGESPQHSTISLPKEGISLHSIYSGPGEPTTEWETQATKVAKGGGHIWLGDINADPNKPQTTKWGQWQDSFQKSGMEPLNHKGKWAKMNTRFPGENEKKKHPT